MNKLFVLATLCLVAYAVTDAECNTAAEDGCTECVGKERNSEGCKTAKNAVTGVEDVEKALTCESLVQCYKKADEDKAAADKKKYNDKVAELCADDKAKCADKNNFCATWAKAKPSQCSENPDWMLVNCQNSCCPVCTGETEALKDGECPEKAEDGKESAQCVANKNKSCGKWSEDGECDANPVWMKKHCMASCCEACKFDKDGCPKTKELCANEGDEDADKKCVAWAKENQCTANPKWMLQNCAKSCCTVCQARAPAQTAVQYAPQPVRYAPQPYAPQQVRYAPQPVRTSFAQPAFGGYGTARAAVPQFGGYNFGTPYGR